MANGNLKDEVCLFVYIGNICHVACLFLRGSLAHTAYRIWACKCIFKRHANAGIAQTWKYHFQKRGNPILMHLETSSWPGFITPKSIDMKMYLKFSHFWLPPLTCACGWLKNKVFTREGCKKFGFKLYN